MTTKTELLQGTLDMLILKALTREPMHGYAIVRWIRQTTDDVLQVEEGSLYPGLYRLEERGWLTSAWGLSEQNRKAKYYKLTRVGITVLQVDVPINGRKLEGAASEP